MGTRLNRLIVAVIMSTHNLCLRAKIRKNVYPCKPQFYYIKVGCKGVYITRTCYPDESKEVSWSEGGYGQLRAAAASRPLGFLDLD